jgi:hypothetical protein
MTQVQIETIMNALENEMLRENGVYTEKYENLEIAYDAIQHLKGE